MSTLHEVRNWRGFTLALGLAWVVSACAVKTVSSDGGDADAADEEPIGGDDGGIDGDETGDGDEGPVEVTLSGVLPSRGPVQGGTWVSVVGSGFVRGIGESAFDVRDVTYVSFGDNPAVDIEVVRDDMLSLRTPPGTAGAVRVTVENPNGRAVLEQAFNYYEAVRVDGYSPEHLPSRGGAAFQLAGAGFTEDSSLLIGGRACSALRVTDSQNLECLSPPLEPGPADLEVFNRNGRARIFHGVRVHAAPRIESVQPAAGPPEGGIQVEARGSGFESGCRLFFGAAEAETTFVDTAILQAVAPAAPAGQVDVTASCLLESHTLPGAFVYLPELQGAFLLAAVAPNVVPAGGGAGVTLVGEGFSAGLDEVLFGTQPATGIAVIDDRQAQATVPALSAGTYDASARQGAEQATLPGALRVFAPLGLTGIEPDLGPCAGGTDAVLSGESLHEQMEVLFGGVPADDFEMISAQQLSTETPPGPAGAVDVIVRDPDSEAVLKNAFSYLSDLGVVRVEPDTGVQAGGTYVTVLGSGFAPGLRVWFGEREGTVIECLGDAAFTARTPRGDPGEVTVKVESGGSSFQLPAGFTYVDPTNDRGGASGGSLTGSFNVTALDASYTRYGEPVAGAVVTIDEPALNGLTDDRGQITFSGPALVRPVTVTVSKPEYESITVAELNSANLTVYLIPNVSEPIVIQPGTVKFSELSGRVFGFKDVPWLEMPAGATLQARVSLTAYSIYGVPPYGGVPTGLEIDHDGGDFKFTLRLGNYSVYAMFGAYDAETDSFTPALLGVRRNIVLMSEEPLGGQDIILSTPLDQSLPVFLLDPPVSYSEKQAEYGVYASLDLGYDGVVYLSGVKGAGSQLLLRGLPDAAAESFLFVGLATVGGGYPLSYVLRRQEGSFGQGLEMGPFLGFVEVLEPPANGEWQSGEISWRTAGRAPQLCQAVIMTNEIMPTVLWRVIMPGTVSQVRLSPEVFAGMPRGEPLILLVYMADSPRFDFDRFNYSQLSTSRWTAYGVQLVNFTVP